MQRKKMMNWTTARSAATLALTAYFASTSAIAEVTSKSPEEFVQYGPEDAYFAFTATCADGAQRVIQRKTDGDNWCAKAVQGFCDVSKDKASERACSNEFALAIGTLESSKREAETEQQAQAEQVSAAQAAEQERENQRQAAALAAQKEQEKQRLAQAEREQARIAAQEKARQQAKIEASKKQIAVEEELLRIEQEKLDLRLQELELKQRTAEIQRKLGDKK